MIIGVEILKNKENQQTKLIVKYEKWNSCKKIQKI